MKVHVAVVAVIVGFMALTAAAKSTAKDSERMQLIPRAGVNLVKCKTITKQVDCNTCEYNRCVAGNTVWTDDVMRCTDRDCRKPKADFERELDEEEIESDEY